MIGKWEEISVELFKEIFNFYLNHEGSSVDKVIEIQNIQCIGQDNETRIFLGSKMNPLDWKEDNKLVVELYDKMKKHGLGEKVLDDISILNVCYFQQGAPLISPIGATSENINLFLMTCFGNKEELDDNPLFSLIKDINETVVWYRRGSDGKINYVTTRPKISDSDKLVRIRVMDYKDWEKIISEGTRSGYFPDKYKKDDIKAEDINRG